MIVGRKSTLFLAYAYELEQDGEALFRRELEGDKARWKTRTIQGAALLPHIDEYIKRGALLRAYDAANDLRGAFGPKDVWRLVSADGKTDVAIQIADPPRLYALDTRYAFIVLGVRPVSTKPDDLTLANLQDVAYALVRAGVSQVKEPPPQMQKWLASNNLTEGDALLRHWLARLVPGLRPDAPRGTPRTTAPLVVTTVLVPEKLGREDLHRLRFVHRSDQDVDPSALGVWNVSGREQCMFSSYGFSWIVEDDKSSQFLADAPSMVRDRYIHKWLLVEHQRLCLLALATECADVSRGLDDADFAEMRLRLLRFIATYNFRHISNEDRHDRFYRRARAALGIDDLLAEVRDEVVEIDTQLASRRAETLNHVLAFLTLVLTPTGLVIGVFQADTLPGKFHLGHLVSGSAWLKLITHPPFLVVVAAMAVGATVFVRLFGLHVIRQLVRRLLPSRD